MTTFITRGIALMAATLAFSGVASAQETNNRVAAKTDWSVFVENNPKECWGVSAPKSTENTEGWQAHAGASRRYILLFVTFRPGKGGEVSFMGGYPFAPGSTVDMVVNNGQKFTLFTDGEGAWAGSPADDAKIVAALKGGADVTLSGHSSRGTNTKDKFSLMGFTAAMDEAEKRCK